MALAKEQDDLNLPMFVGTFSLDVAQISVKTVFALNIRIR